MNGSIIITVIIIMSTYIDNGDVDPKPNGYDGMWGMTVCHKIFIIYVIINELTIIHYAYR